MGFEQDLRAYLEGVEADPARVHDPKETLVASYSLETYLVRRERKSARVTPLGEAFLRLRGRDSVQWLLLVEVTLSKGWDDRWRVSRTMLAEALTERGIEIVRVFGALGTVLGHGNSTLDRMRDLGVLGYQLRESADHYFIPAAMREVVANVLVPGPWRSAVEALLADERAAAVPGLQTKTADVMVEQTRMIVHEIRNALVPVRVHLDSILNPDDEVPLAPTVTKARKGVVRVLEFVEQMLETSEIVSEATAHDAGRLVREAIGRLDGGERVQLIEPATILRVRGHGRQLVIAISNVITNAMQAAAAPRVVRVAVTGQQERIRIVVDDAGAGVPKADRTRVFDQGFTTRPGGSGFGLAYVKRTVEALPGGRVWCEDSDLGGARFVIELSSDDPS